MKRRRWTENPREITPERYSSLIFRIKHAKKNSHSVAAGWKVLLLKCVLLVLICDVFKFYWSAWNWRENEQKSFPTSVWRDIVKLTFSEQSRHFKWAQAQIRCIFLVQICIHHDYGVKTVTVSYVKCFIFQMKVFVFNANFQFCYLLPLLWLRKCSNCFKRK